MPDSPTAEPTASTADSLRALRRGLQRSAGRFALFVAVCERAETRKDLIRLLGESMPGVDLTTATFDAETVDPIEDVLTQVGKGQGPVMILGLERSVPMEGDDWPLLRTINLERAEWPERLQRPIVLWIPTLALGILGRTAPDFLDWRSDTVYFSSQPDAVDRELFAFDDSMWRGGLDRRMPEVDRRHRMAELRSRIRTTPVSTDPVVEESRFRWLGELGSHLSFAGKFSEAEDCFQLSLMIPESLGNRRLVALTYYRLGGVAERRGSLQEATEWCRKSIAIRRELRDEGGVAANYNLMGVIAHKKGALEEAREWYDQALEISERLRNRSDVATSFHNLGILSLDRGKLEDAVGWFGKSLDIWAELEENFGAALSVSMIAALLFLSGRVEDAVRLHVQNFGVQWRVGSFNRSIDAGWLRRERQALGEDRFRELVEEHAESPDIGSVILKASVAPLGELVHEVAETPADYGADVRSDYEA